MTSLFLTELHPLLAVLNLAQKPLNSPVPSYLTWRDNGILLRDQERQMTTNQDIIMYQPTMWWGGWPVRLQTSLGAMFFSETVLQDMDLFQKTQRCFLYTTTHLATQTWEKLKKKIDLTLSWLVKRAQICQAVWQSLALGYKAPPGSSGNSVLG